MGVRLAEWLENLSLNQRGSSPARCKYLNLHTHPQTQTHSDIHKTNIISKIGFSSRKPIKKKTFLNAYENNFLI